MLKIAYFLLLLSILILIGALTERHLYNKQRETAKKLCGTEENIAFVDTDTVMCKRDNIVDLFKKE